VSERTVNRRLIGLALTLALGVLGAPPLAGAQPPPRAARIGVLVGGSPSNAVEGLREGLHALGWVEGQNLLVEYRYAEGNYERFDRFMAELVRANVDVIVATINPAIIAARKATSTIPIVTVFAMEPVQMGYVASLARPGGNVTGTTLVVGDELFGKQLELLKEIVPRVSRVAVLSHAAHPRHPAMLRAIQAPARALGVRVLPVTVRGPDDLANAFATIRRERAGALLVLIDAMFVEQRTRLADLAIRSRLPSMYGVTGHVEAGGLAAYAASLRDLYRRVAGYVDKILKGARPGDLPMEQPTKFQFTVNLKTARALGLTVPPGVLARADEVLE